MNTVKCKLKWFSLTKNRKRVTLTGTWSDGDEKKWVSLSVAKPLVELGLVKKTGQTWDDGNPKYAVQPDTVISLVTKEVEGIETQKILVDGETVNKPQSVIDDGWERLELVYGECARIARTAWLPYASKDGERFDDRALAAAANSLFIEANKRDLSFRKVPIEPKDFEKPPLPEEPPDDLPF